MSLRQSQSSRGHDAGSHSNPPPATAGGGTATAGAGPSGGSRNSVAPHVSGSNAVANVGQATSTKGPGAANTAAVATPTPGAAGGTGGGPGAGKKRESVCPVLGSCVSLCVLRFVHRQAVVLRVEVVWFVIGIRWRQPVCWYEGQLYHAAVRRYPSSVCR